jgi:uracil phosphoribosyltransferase
VDLAMKNVYEIEHPLIQHHLARLRDRETTSVAFRHSVERLATLVTYEAARDLEVEPTTVETPLATAACRVIRQRVGLVPILRAGLGMVDPILNLIPCAEVWHLGFYRDERTLKPVEYYKKLPTSRPVEVALVLDPMLATGGSALAAFRAVREWGVERIKLLCLIAAPEGIKAVHAEYPDTQIYVCAIDSHLNNQAYIVPGLGDAGDRIFNAQAE